MMPVIETQIPTRALSLAALALAAVLATSLPACAQVVAIVGGEPITEVDIQQRSRLIELSTQKKPPRQEVLDDLIDDKLKVQLSKRYIAEVPRSKRASTQTLSGRRSFAANSRAACRSATRKSK